MKSKTRFYASIDLKSFYASVECIERGLDLLNTNLVVADESRTTKTICLAVSVALKSFDIPSRLRLFELIDKINRINYDRKAKCKEFQGKSIYLNALRENQNLQVDFLIAKPRMKTYIHHSALIYQVYMRYFAPKDIFLYSIDEVFIDITSYLPRHNNDAKALISQVLKDIVQSTKIIATAGIGTNLYLAKVAMDILAKHQKEDSNGVRIALLDERSYKEQLWNHTPLRDFWRVGKGYEEILHKIGIQTMGQLARFSLHNEERLYKLFGINAELLIDHAFGYEPCTMQDIKGYKTLSTSKGAGKVLPEPYCYTRAKKVLANILDSLVLELIRENLLTSQIILDIKYDKENLIKNPQFSGKTRVDNYGFTIPKNAHGTENIGFHTSSIKIINSHCLALFDRIIDKNLTIRKLSLSLNSLVAKENARETRKEISLFSDFEKLQKDEQSLQKENKLQKARLAIINKFGNDKLFKASSLSEKELNLNNSIGGHNG